MEKIIFDKIYALVSGGRTLFGGRTLWGEHFSEGRTLWGEHFLREEHFGENTFLRGEHFGENTFFCVKKLRFEEGRTRVPTVQQPAG